MKLKEFVKQSLLDITEGVTEAQKETKLYIAPGFIEGEKVTSVQNVSFEVAVTVGKEASAGIRVWTLGEAKAGGDMEHSTKISFEVPVYFQAPTELNEKHYSHKVQKKSEKI